jgi:vacuolar protein sorting-associated protein 35
MLCSLQLVRRLQKVESAEEAGGITPKKVFQFLHQTVEALANVPAPEVAFRLYLLCAEVRTQLLSRECFLLESISVLRKD